MMLLPVCFCYRNFKSGVAHWNTYLTIVPVLVQAFLLSFHVHHNDCYTSLFQIALRSIAKGSIPLKKSGILWKSFTKWRPPPPVLLLWNPYSEFFQKFDRISGTYGFLNKRYEIRLTPPPRLWKSFIKFRIFLKECFPNCGLYLYA